MPASRDAGLGSLVLATAAVVACSSPAAIAPPRVDLAGYGTVGLIEFSAGPQKELGQLATQEFAASILTAQPGIPVLELGDETELLVALERDAIDPETIQAIGKKYSVDAVVFGTLTARDAAPRIALDSVEGWIHAGAEVQGSLTTRLLDARNGATLWTRTAGARETVAQIEVSRGGVAASGRDLERAQGRLVQALVERVTHDFRQGSPTSPR
jgi:hypothetical protein